MMKQNMTNDSLGDRMKEYESVTRMKLSHRIPAIIRIDGRAFHTLTRRLYGGKWSPTFSKIIMPSVAAGVMSGIQGCNFAYGQSDEVSFLLTDYRTVHTSAWFDYVVQKLVSVTASLATMEFVHVNGAQDMVTFDARAFSLPHDEVVNYFIWRQQDATRNAIQMMGHEHLTQSELNFKNCDEIQELLFTNKGINFNDSSTVRKRGYCIINGVTDFEIPIFTQDRQYVEQFVNIRED